MYDTLIKNGNIIDGTGEKMFKADLGIKGDKIVKIGNLSDEKANKIIDAKNLLVCPGFIDIANRSDMYWQIFFNPTLESLLHQGITTIIGGGSGSSLAPIYSEDMLMSVRKWIDMNKVNVNWHSLEEFLNFVESCNLSVNFGTLVGHITLRRGLIGDENRELSDLEMEFLQRHIKVCLKQGALGVSSGLAYIHGRSITEDELIKVAELVKDGNGLHMISPRYERNKFIGGIDEIMRVADKSKARVHINHLKVVGEKNISDLNQGLDLINSYICNGNNISFDVYPYTFSAFVLYSFLPIWATEGGLKMMLSRLKDKETANRIVKDIHKKNLNLASARVFNDSFGNNFEDKKLDDLAKSHNKSVEEMILQLILVYEGRAMVLLDILDKENLEEKIKNKNSIITTNGSGYNKDNLNEVYHIVHPRSFGTFPKFFSEYVRKNDVLNWEEAVYKSTGKPAQQLNLKKRGFLKEGYFADVSIIDPNVIMDRSTEKKVLVYAKGVSYVMVNGNLVVEKEKFNGNRSGRVLRS